MRPDIQHPPSSSSDSWIHNGKTLEKDAKKVFVFFTDDGYGLTILLLSSGINRNCVKMKHGATHTGSYTDFNQDIWGPALISHNVRFAVASMLLNLQIITITLSTVPRAN